MSPKFIFIPKIEEDGFLFDTYPGLVGIDAAFQLKTGLTDSHNVRRSNDQAESVISYDSNGEINLSSPSVTDSTYGGFVGVNNGFAQRVYDSGSAGLTIEQSTAAQQMEVVDSGSLVTSGGLPAFDGATITNKGYQSTTALSVSGASEVWVFAVLELINTARGQRYFSSGNLGNTDGVFTVSNELGSFAVRLRASGTQLFLQCQTPSVAGRYIVSTKIPSSGLFSTNAEIYINGVSQTLSINTDGTANGFSDNICYLFNNHAFSTSWGDKIQHISIYTGDQSANRANIETLLNNKYNVY